MPFKLPKTASLAVCAEYVLRVEASLLAETETQELATPWTVLQTRVKEARDKREAGERTLAIMAGKVRAADVKWDRVVLDLSSTAFFHAKKDAKALPYARLFGTIKATDMRKMGASKSVGYGKQLLTDLQQLDHEALAPHQEKLQKANDNLMAADTLRDDAKRAFRSHDLTRQALIEEIEKQIILTEIELLKQEYDRIAVRAFLSPYESEATDEDADEPETTPTPAP